MKVYIIHAAVHLHCFIQKSKAAGFLVFSKASVWENKISFYLLFEIHCAAQCMCRDVQIKSINQLLTSYEVVCHIHIGYPKFKRSL